jgi:hypothetical protein
MYKYVELIIYENTFYICAVTVNGQIPEHLDVYSTYARELKKGKINGQITKHLVFRVWHT